MISRLFTITCNGFVTSNLITRRGPSITRRDLHLRPCMPAPAACGRKPARHRGPLRRARLRLL
jgi:hypothetical protein